MAGGPAHVTGAFPILTVADLDRSLAFYAGLLGGSVTYRFPEEGDPVFVTLDLGGGSLGLGEDPGVPPAPGPARVELCAYAEDCDAAVEALRDAGTPVLDEPADQPWGERMARVADPDGNRVLILTPLAAG
ncbi:MAG TPA: VOC family protein [Miltoncostaeaceae bacterium]|nr:VOC family protein [Miltoncostaeaceae bacterium]